MDRQPSAAIVAMKRPERQVGPALLGPVTAAGAILARHYRFIEGLNCGPALPQLLGFLKALEPAPVAPRATSAMSYLIGVVRPVKAWVVDLSSFSNRFAENLGSGNLADGFTGLGNLAQGEDLHYAFDVILQGWSPVPEPASLGLIGGGALLVLLIRTKRSKNSTQGRSR